MSDRLSETWRVRAARFTRDFADETLEDERWLRRCREAERQVVVTEYDPSAPSAVERDAHPESAY